MIETSGARWGTVVVFRGRRVIERFKNDVVSTRSDIVEERGGGDNGKISGVPSTAG